MQSARILAAVIALAAVALSPSILTAGTGGRQVCNGPTCAPAGQSTVTSQVVNVPTVSYQLVPVQSTRQVEVVQEIRDACPNGICTPGGTTVNVGPEPPTPSPPGRCGLLRRIIGRLRGR